MSSTPDIYQRWSLRAGKAQLFTSNARAWLPKGATLVGFVPDYTGTPLTGGTVYIVDNKAQQLITAAADAAAGSYVVPVDVTNDLGETDRQAFLMEVT